MGASREPQTSTWREHSIVQQKIARHLNRGEAVPPGLAENLAASLAKKQRSRLGQLQNMRRCGELR
jgi:hypothetical protein